MQGLDEAARRDPEAEAVTQQRRDLLERHAHVFMQEHHKSHGSRSEVHIGGSQRVGGHVHVRGDRTSRSAAIAGAGAPTRPSTPAPRATLRARRGRPEPGPPCGVELLAEAFTLALPPIPVTLRARQLLAQTSDLFLLPLEQIVAFGPGRLCALIGYTRFMAASRQKYKYEIVDLAESPPKRRPHSLSGRRGAVQYVELPFGRDAVPCVGQPVGRGPGGGASRTRRCAVRQRCARRDHPPADWPTSIVEWGGAGHRTRRGCGRIVGQQRWYRRGAVSARRGVRVARGWRDSWSR